MESRLKWWRLKNVEAALVMQTLNSIFQQGQQFRGGGRNRAQGQGQGQAQGGSAALTNPLNISNDDRSNTLILSGQKETLETGSADY